MKPVVRIYDTGDDEILKLRIKSDLSYEDTLTYLVYAIADLTKLDYRELFGFILYLGNVNKKKVENEKKSN